MSLDFLEQDSKIRERDSSTIKMEMEVACFDRHAGFLGKNVCALTKYIITPIHNYIKLLSCVMEYKYQLLENI
jgi:hypothetical protein